MKKILSLLFIAALLAGCSSTKKVTYFQDLQNGETQAITTLAKKIKMQPGDKISIVVNSQTPEFVARYNLIAPTMRLGSTTIGNGNNEMSAYTIDSYGCIDFPEMGKIPVEGKTREEVADYIKNELITRKLVLDPTVTVEYVNQQISMLGEVNKPGKININKDYITILDAIAMAGDLKIEGKRADVTVLRQEGDKQKLYEIDLTSADAIYSSPAYYLQQNDIVYVKPNNKRAGQADINSNTMRSTSFWMSLASFVMALITFIDNR
ncbi:MAG: polysaccharide biosynthesis/export family protein [Bacteroidaceae bacterium]|nr:polysaccharide biosynthesis/export family protein [Bacteroidaceae bacterium]